MYIAVEVGFINHSLVEVQRRLVVNKVESDGE